MNKHPQKAKLIFNKHRLYILGVGALAIVLCLLILLTNNQINRPDTHQTSTPSLGQSPTSAVTPQPTAQPDYTVANQYGSQFSGFGKFTHQGNYIYYIYQNAIYKCHVNGSSAIQLILTDGGFDINVIGDNILYAQNDGIYCANIYTGKLYKMHSCSPQKLAAMGNTLYYLQDSTLYSYNMPTKTEQAVASSLSDFAFCGQSIITVKQNPSYGVDLYLLGSQTPFASNIAAYTVENEYVYAEAIEGMLSYDVSNDCAQSALPISFDMIPDVLVSAGDCILFTPRGSHSLYSKDKTTGLTKTVIDEVDEFYYVFGNIIYRTGDKWYTCSANGWQRRLLTDGIAPAIEQGSLSCSSLEFRLYDNLMISPGQTATLNLFINGQPATSAQLQMLALYIKDNTVLSCSQSGDVLMVTGKASGTTILRVASSEKTVFAEVLITVR